MPLVGRAEGGPAIAGCKRIEHSHIKECVFVDVSVCAYVCLRMSVS